MRTDTDVISEESYEDDAAQFGELKKLKSPRKKNMTEIEDGLEFTQDCGFMNRALAKIQDSEPPVVLQTIDQNQAEPEDEEILNLENLDEAALRIFESIFDAELFDNQEYISREQYQNGLFAMNFEEDAQQIEHFMGLFEMADAK